MIQNSVDVATYVSPNLSALIESQVKDPDAAQPATLASVRAFIENLLPASLNAAEGSIILISMHRCLMNSTY